MEDFALQVVDARRQGPVSAEEEARYREHELDRTPRPIVRQALYKLIARSQPRRVLDFCAGSGVYSSEAKRIATDLRAGPLHVTALELRAEERPWLEQHADEVVIADWREAVGDLGRFDAIVCNPAFSLWVEALPVLLEHLRPGGLVLALLHNGVGQRAMVEPASGGETFEFFDVYPPFEQWRIRGPIKFRGPNEVNPKTGKKYGSDVRDYSHWLWSEQHSRGHGSPRLCDIPGGACRSWLTCDLPRLPSSEREWQVEPGREAG